MKYAKNSYLQSMTVTNRTNDKELVNDKCDSYGNQVKINIDNVILNKNSNNRINYNKNQEKTNPISLYNYDAPLDGSPKRNQNKNWEKITSYDDNDDLQTLTMLNNYESEMPTTIEKKSNGGWEGVGEKQREKQKAAIHEDTSTRYLPKYMMPGCKPDTPIVATTKIFPLNIKLRPPEDNKQYLLLKRNIVSSTPLYAAQVIIPKQQDNSITAAVAMITINQNTNKD
jgi:hypothetical protein